MKHDKTWYTCDRCGADIEKVPSPWIIGPRYKKVVPLELQILTLQRGAYIADTELIAPEVLSMSVVEYYDKKEKHIHLCADCRKKFFEFMDKTDF